MKKLLLLITILCISGCDEIDVFNEASATPLEGESGEACGFGTPYPDDCGGDGTGVISCDEVEVEGINTYVCYCDCTSESAP